MKIIVSSIYPQQMVVFTEPVTYIEYHRSKGYLYLDLIVSHS